MGEEDDEEVESVGDHEEEGLGEGAAVHEGDYEGEPPELAES